MDYNFLIVYFYFSFIQFISGIKSITNIFPPPVTKWVVTLTQVTHNKPDVGRSIQSDINTFVSVDGENITYKLLFHQSPAPLLLETCGKV